MGKGGKNIARFGMTFIGQYQHSIDAKGRLSIPAKFRDALGESFVITQGPDNCLFVYAMQDWKELEEKFKKLSFTKAKARAFSRLFFSGADAVEADKLGRALLAGHLRNFAGLEKEVMVIGVGNRLEIWDLKRWQDYSASAVSDYEDITEDLVDFDIEL